MRLRPGTLVKLSEATEIDTSNLCAYAATRLRPSRKRALYLQKITGIEAELWLFGSSKELKLAITKYAGFKVPSKSSKSTEAA